MKSSQVSYFSTVTDIIMKTRIIVTACVSGGLAVALGAFGAHGLKQSISAADLENWKTAVNYQFYHTLALLFLAIFTSLSGKKVGLAYWGFTIGIIFFSGSLYLLSTRSLTGLSSSFLGPVTPLGGLSFIAGWIGLLVSAVKGKNA